MKKIFSVRRNALFERTSFTYGLAGLLLALALVGLRVAAPNSFLKLIAPVAIFGAAVSSDLHGLTSAFRSAAALSASNEALLAENAALGAENRSLLEKLRALERRGSTNSSGIFAGVIIRPPESAYDTYVIDAGSADGVAEGMAAYGPAGLPLGVVTSVTEDFSRVSLFSKSGTRIHAWAGEQHIPLVLEGQGGGAFLARMSRSANLKEGDVVFVAGSGAVAMGTIAKLDSDASDPAVSILIKPVINPFSVAWVTLRGNPPAELLATSSALFL